MTRALSSKRNRHVEPLEWTDVDGDKARLTVDPDEIGDTGALAVFVATSVETREQGSVYIDEQDARRLIAWLSERLGAL